MNTTTINSGQKLLGHLSYITYLPSPLDSSQPSVFSSIFIPSLNARVEPWENWTQAQSLWLAPRVLRAHLAEAVNNLIPPNQCWKISRFFHLKGKKITWLSTLKVWEGKNSLCVATHLSGIDVSLQPHFIKGNGHWSFKISSVLLMKAQHDTI